MQNFLAYIDPAATALIWQILAGITITLGVVLGIWWRKISTFFKGIWTKLFKKKSDDAEQKAAQDELASELEETDTSESLDLGETTEQPSETTEQPSETTEQPSEEAEK